MTCTAYVDPPGTDLTQPVISFRTDVIPIFHTGCAFPACHATESPTTNHGLMLGFTSDLSSIRTGLVGVHSFEVPSLAFVAPSDPGQSYLLHKIDGDVCTLESLCKDASCLRQMPIDNEPLSVETRDIIRRWIAQGAPDN